MRSLISFFMLFLLITSYGQGYPIVIELNNGTTKEGEIEGWAGRLILTGNTEYKSGNTKVKVPYKDIKAFAVFDKGEMRKFEKIKAYRNPNNRSIDRNDLYAEILYEGYNITLYYGIYGMIGSSDLRFFCIRNDEEVASVVSFIFGTSKNQIFKSAGAKYFSDYPELSEKIKKKEYTYKDIIEVVRIYDSWKSTQ